MVNFVKQYVNKVTITLMLLLVASLGVNVENALDDEGYLPYGCAVEDKDDMFCYKLSRLDKATNTANRYCYFDRDKSSKYKVCNTGWHLLSEVEEPEVKTCEPEVITNTNTVMGACPNTMQVKYVMENGVLNVYYCNEPGPKQICTNEKDLMI